MALSGITRCLVALIAGVPMALVAGCGGEAKETGAAGPVTVTVTEPIDAAPTPQTGTEDGSGDDPGVTDIRFGNQGRDGDLAFRVVSLTEAESVPLEFGDPVTAPAGAKVMLVRVTYRNDGTVRADPFCGGRGIVLIDERSRNFDPVDEAVSVAGNQICEGVQPGFRSTESIPFVVPSDARVTAVAVWDADDEDDFQGDNTWLRFKR